MASRVPKINDNPKKTNSLFYLKKAKKACIESNYAEAYEYFVHYFESLNDPSEATTAVQMVFTKLVCKIGTVLEETDNIEELLKCYIQTINLFPQNYVILNNLGAYMFRMGEIDIARRYLELAYKASDNYLPAEKNLMIVKWHQIPRWHFRMLNDIERNISYEKAISSVMAKGYKNVVDIGAGCGLLSLLASRDPEASIVAYEENKSLYKMCYEVMKENNVKNVNVVNCYSTNVTEPPQKCNLIVTEIFDVALFGERALESILHALTVLRTEEDYKIIPCGATIYVTGINSQELLSKNQVLHKNYLNLLNLDKMCIKQYELEPYDAEHLSEKNVVYMTDTQEIFTVNFCDCDYISQLVNDDNFHHIVKLTCKEGIIHALAVWFDLNLTEDISITTNPLDENYCKCWEQAVFYLDHPLYVREGEILTLRVAVCDCKLNFDVIGREDITHDCVRVSKDIVTFINDDKLMESIVAVAQKYADSNLTVVDFNIFPLLALLLAKNKNCSVYHALKNDCDKEFLQQVMALNDIPEENFVFLEEDIKLGVNIGQKPSLYFFDTISPDGSLENTFLRKRSEIISTINVPRIIKVNVQLIYSWYLEHCNRVRDQNVFNFRIEKLMNEYTGCEHLNLEKFEYESYADPVSFLLDGDGEKSLQIVVNKSGLVNSLYYWYELQFCDNIVFSTSESSHFNRSCFLLNAPRKVTAAESFQIVLHTMCSHIKLTLR